MNGRRTKIGSRLLQELDELLDLGPGAMMP